MQTMKLRAAFAALALLGTTLGATSAISASDAIGRISYIYPDGHRLILDAQREYNLAPSVDVGRIGVAEFVRLHLAPDGRTAVSVSPGPDALAGYWTGQPSQS